MKRYRDSVLSLIVSVVLAMGLMPALAIAAEGDAATEDAVALENDGAVSSSVETVEATEQPDDGAEESDSADGQGTMQQSDSAEAPNSTGNAAYDGFAPESNPDEVAAGEIGQGDDADGASEGQLTEEDPETDLVEQGLDDRYSVGKAISGNGSGTVTIVSGSAYPYYDEEVCFTAIPQKGSRLARLSVTTADGETYRVNDSLWKDEYYQEVYNDDGSVEYVAAYYFWMPDCDVTINATFETIPRYAISKNYVGGNNGTVTIIGDGATLYPYAGDLVVFRTSPKTGYTLTRMSYTTESGKTMALTRVEGSGKAGTNSVYEFTMPAENVTLNATFAENHRNIYKEIEGNGQLMLVDNGSGKATMYPKPGDKVRFKAIPGSGYKLMNCNYTLSSTGKTLALSKVAGTTNIYEFTMPNEDVTLGGRFVPSKPNWRSNGRYVVGKDIPAGLYVFTGTVQYYEWDANRTDPHIDGQFECLKRAGSGWETFRSGYFFEESSVATKRCYAEVEYGEVIQVSDGARFTLAETTAPLNTKSLKSEGTYRVGYDCPAGLYLVTENTDQYAYATYEIEPSVGSYHSDEYYENWVYGKVLSEEYVRVVTGDYLTLNDCTAKWVKS